MKQQCPAKVNLFLEVTGEKKDGYHTLSTLFAKINIYDVLDMEFRRNILLIYKEILHNILKHANASRVDIVLQEQHENFMLTITDNGVGFDPSLAYTGNGLKNLQNRAVKSGGKLEIKSSTGKGTSICLNAKIP